MSFKPKSGQLVWLVDNLKEFLKGKKDSDVQKDLKLTESFSSEEIKKLKSVKEIEDILSNLKDRIETNYDNTTQKISTVYEKKLREYIFIWGIILALFINADIFEIYSTFSSNVLFRDKLAAQAEVINSQMKLINEQQIKEKETESIKELVKEAKITITAFNKNMTEAGLHLGWSWEHYDRVKNFFYRSSKDDGKKPLTNRNEMSKKSEMKEPQNKKNRESKKGETEKIEKSKIQEGNPVSRDIFSFLKKMLGIIISGLLISFGAPFWHEFLRSFTGIRNMLRGGGRQKQASSSPSPAH